LYLKELWTPQLETRLGYCDYSCTSCGQVCPSGAIRKLPLIDKQKTSIGTARIDKKRCLPWAEDVEYIVCEEMCPVPQKAVRLEERVVVNSSYEVITLLQPTVIPDLCIGCGICEYKCPVEGEAAIRIYPNKL
jgi:ferredoxin